MASKSEAENSLTRDFLGMGENENENENQSRRFLQENFDQFASMGHYSRNHWAIQVVKFRVTGGTLKGRLIKVKLQDKKLP